MASHIGDHIIDLLSAIEYGSMKYVRKALDQGSDVNRKRGKLLPLQTAAMLGNIEILNVLIKHGAEVNASDDFGRTALHYAGENTAEAVDILMKEHYADPEIRDTSGATPLHWAAYKAKLECVQALLRNGADVNALNDFGETALFWAVKKTALDVVRLLLDHNADPDVTNSKGEVAVQKAWFLYSLQFDCDDDMKIMNLLCESSPHLPWNSSEKEVILKAMERNNESSFERLKLLLQTNCYSLTLKHLSRCSIRRTMGRVYIPLAVRQLSIPPALKDYLLLQETSLT